MSKAAPKKLKVASMPHAYVSEDGSLVELEFITEEDAPTTLSFDAEQFEQFSSRAIQLFTHARSQKLAIRDHLAIHAVEVVAATAEAATGGGKVILALRGDKGLLFHFALQPDDAEGLRPNLYRAAKSAKKQTAQSRH